MNNKRNLRANSAGLSLIEGVIAFAIIGVVAFFGFSYFKSIQGDSGLTASIGDFGDNTQLDEVARAIVSDLGIVQARSKTGVQDVEWGVCFRNNKDKGKDLYEAVSNVNVGNDPCNVGNAGKVESTINLPKDIFISDPLVEQTKYVIFKRITGATTSPTDLTITISSESDDSRTITITPEGIITYSGSSVVEEVPEEPVISVTPSPQSNTSVPSSPRSLAASPGISKVAIAWSAPSFRGNSAIIEYKIYRGTTSGARGSFIDSVTPSNFSFVDNNVSNGTTYFYRVTARNSAGESGVSNQVPATPFTATPTPTNNTTPTTSVKTVPSVPRNLSAIAGNTKVALTWNSPSSNGGDSISEYNIYRSLVSGGPQRFVTSTSGTAYTDTGLSNGTRYYYRIAALNSYGEGPRSSEVRAIPTLGSSSSNDTTELSAPRNLTATPGSHQATLAWDEPSSSGGSSITEYRLYRALVSNGPRTEITRTSGTAYTDTGLSNGTRYYYSVEARNSDGVGPRSSEVMVIPVAGTSTTDDDSDDDTNNDATDNTDNNDSTNNTSTATTTAPSAPQNFRVVEKDSYAYLTWSAPSSDGGSQITSYTIARTSSPNGLTEKYYSTSNRYFSDTNVDAGKTYYYRVWASNIYNGTRSGEVAITMSGSETVISPSAPRNVSAVGRDSKVDLTWSAPSSDGGSQITSYTIARTSSPNGLTEKYYSTSNRYFSDTNVDAGKTYYYRVWANNAYYNGVRSVEVSAAAK